MWTCWQGDPLTIRLLIEALRDGALTPGKLTSLPLGLELFVKDWLEELVRYSDEAEAVSTLLSLCAVALGPLTNAGSTPPSRGADCLIAL